MFETISRTSLVWTLIINFLLMILSSFIFWDTTFIIIIILHGFLLLIFLVSLKISDVVDFLSTILNLYSLNDTITGAAMFIMLFPEDLNIWDHFTSLNFGKQFLFLAMTLVYFINTTSFQTYQTKCYKMLYQNTIKEKTPTSYQTTNV